MSIEEREFTFGRCVLRDRLGAAAVLILMAFGLTAMHYDVGAAPVHDQPTIAKDSVQVNAFTFNVYQKNYNIWSWVPRMDFRVNGPIPSGSQLYVLFSTPAGMPWVKFDCATEETAKDRWWKTSCGGRDIPENKGSLGTGPFGFAI